MSNKSSITNNDVEKISNLAKIKLKSDEIEKYRQELSPALEVAKSFEELDVSKTGIMSHATGAKNVLREDESGESLSQKQVLQNSVKSKDGYILIQRNSKK